MDIENKTNKAMSADDASNKAADSPTSLKAVSTLINEYFFPGGGVWKPMSIQAPNREQAEEIYKVKREPVTPAEGGKVGDSKETNNE
jgi:hypothetical protein